MEEAEEVIKAYFKGTPLKEAMKNYKDKEGILKNIINLLYLVNKESEKMSLDKDRMSQMESFLKDIENLKTLI